MNFERGRGRKQTKNTKRSKKKTRADKAEGKTETENLSTHQLVSNEPPTLRFPLCSLRTCFQHAFHQSSHAGSWDSPTSRVIHRGPSLWLPSSIHVMMECGRALVLAGALHRQTHTHTHTHCDPTAPKHQTRTRWKPPTQRGPPHPAKMPEKIIYGEQAANLSAHGVLPNLRDPTIWRAAVRACVCRAAVHIALPWNTRRLDGQRVPGCKMLRFGRCCFPSSSGVCSFPSSFGWWCSLPPSFGVVVSFPSSPLLGFPSSTTTKIKLIERTIKYRNIMIILFLSSLWLYQTIKVIECLSRVVDLRLILQISKIRNIMKKVKIVPRRSKKVTS